MGIHLPPQSGTYALILRQKRGATIKIGKFGTFDFKRGWYVYIGSAFGPGGLCARTGRHLKRDKTRRWHIDYLTATLHLSRIWLTICPQKQECHWADLISAMGGKTLIPGFGASDCSCSAHLFFFQQFPSLSVFRRQTNVPVRVIKTR